MRALLVVCAFNEGIKFEKTCERIYHYISHRDHPVQMDVLVVDDASTDSVPKKMADRYGFLYFRNEEREGIGFSIRRGYDFGAKNGYDIFAVMAGNNKDNPDELDQLFDPIWTDKADFVQGSRYLKGGQFGNMPFYRLASTRFLHPLLFSLVAGQKITDSTNGFRVVRASLLKDPHIQLHQDWLNQYELEPYLFCQAIRLGYRVIEVPVTKIYPDKSLGYSKMKPLIGWWSILRPLVFLFFRMKK